MSGCTVEEMLTSLTQHEPQCEYRDVRCPVGYCDQSVPMTSLSHHYSSPPHSLPTISTDQAELSLVRSIPTPAARDTNNTASYMRSFEPIRFTFNGDNFYLQTIVNPERRFMYNFIQMEGSKEDCSKYLVKVSMSSCDPDNPLDSSSTIRPVTLDQHCRDDLMTIEQAMATTER